MNKKTSLLLIVILSLINLNLRAQQESCFPISTVTLENLKERLVGNWEYDYSFNADSAFQVDGNYFDDGYVPFRIEFKITSKRENKRIAKRHPELMAFRKESCLEELSFWVDYKGVMRYPKLFSSKKNSSGYLTDCKIELMSKLDYLENDFVSIKSLSGGILVIYNYQGDNRKDYHVFVREVSNR